MELVVRRRGSDKSYFLVCFLCGMWIQCDKHMSSDKVISIMDVSVCSECNEKYQNKEELLMKVEEQMLLEI